MNFHYVFNFQRAKLMNALWEISNNDKMNKTTKLIISYKILNSAAQFSYFKPCVKKYLFDHVKSPFIYISPEYWDAAVMLPTARFQKANQQRVWLESSQKAAKHRQSFHT